MITRPSPIIEIAADAEPTDAFVRCLAAMCLAKARREIAAEQEQTPPTKEKEVA